MIAGGAVLMGLGQLQLAFAENIPGVCWAGSWWAPATR